MHRPRQGLASVDPRLRASATRVRPPRPAGQGQDDALAEVLVHDRGSHVGDLAPLRELVDANTPTVSSRPLTQTRNDSITCTVLAADRDTLRAIRARVAAREDVFVADMPAEAQATRVYAEYLDAVAASPSDRLEYLAVSLVGPRNPVDRIVGRLPLLP